MHSAGNLHDRVRPDASRTSLMTARVAVRVGAAVRVHGMHQPAADTPARRSFLSFHSAF
jgi:hypothetical protein